MDHANTRVGKSDEPVLYYFRRSAGREFDLKIGHLHKFPYTPGLESAETI